MLLYDGIHLLSLYSYSSLCCSITVYIYPYNVTWSQCFSLTVSIYYPYKATALYVALWRYPSIHVKLQFSMLLYDGIHLSIYRYSSLCCSMKVSIYPYKATALYVALWRYPSIHIKLQLSMLLYDGIFLDI